MQRFTSVFQLEFGDGIKVKRAIQWSIKWTHLSSQRVARCHHVTGKIKRRKNIPRNQKQRRRAFWRESNKFILQTSFTFQASTSAVSEGRQKSADGFYDWKRSRASEMEQTKNQTQSDVPLCRTGFSMKFKMLLRYQRRMTIAFCCLTVIERAGKRAIKAQRRGWWKIKNVINRNFNDEKKKSHKFSINFSKLKSIKRVTKKMKILFGASSVTNWNAWSALFVIILYPPTH